MGWWNRKRVVVRAILPGRDRRRAWRASELTREASLARLLAQHLKEAEAESHPWCFVLVEDGQAWVGAIKAATGETLYVALSVTRAEDVLISNGSLAFWLARALAAPLSLAGRIRPIERHYCADAGFTQAAPLMPLLADCCKADYVSTDRCGVELMPWAAWPACIHQGGYLWLWKQNQYGRIVASRRISLIHK
ncbi:hypothetical protein RIN58_16230 [Siccibacter colletis]|uniref:hypothetical protein n=1 Tax=Siccibacter colletis TaxID=1505757 RepID=UPI0028BD98AF|nr:hypothetical protein [Siccibacter colletis]WNN47908.1 hypothetical protein RIN58_16230 [Siccibacter colletis]